MKTELFSISKIFTERLIRIPDYQRGYAWTARQLKDFWNDLLQLEENKSHYTGVLTLEEVPSATVSNWSDDYWIIQSKGFAPFYVVDGQQRLTTTIILIEAIVERVGEGGKLNYTTIPEIKKKFIFDSKDEGISRSYIFGYERDNPSYEFLKRRIFLEPSEDASPIQETIYTHNLEFAKTYFVEKLRPLSVPEIEDLYRKLTQNFLFNIYSIANEVDVFVAFETMNNRGKPLSHLELLKNRLIYLSTMFEGPDFERTRLRHAINEAWKAIYHYLGKNKANPLDDDVFLSTHFVLYFGDELQKSGDFAREVRYHYRRGVLTSTYNEYLLEKKFTPKSLPSRADGNQEPLSIQEIYSYVRSLKESVEIWYTLMNPQDSTLSTEEKEWLAKLNRLGFIEIAALVLVFFQKERSPKLRVRLLKSAERMLFLRTLLRYYPIELEVGEYFAWAGELSKGDSNPEKVIRDLDAQVETFISNPQVMIRIVSDFRTEGFYSWRGIRYFLFEYELHLKSRSKTDRDKLDWEILMGRSPEEGEHQSDYHTVEHIYPQRPRKPCWTNQFSAYSEKGRKILRHSLGNLVPLSRPKNSSFQNQCFEDKVGKPGSTVGFRYGSFSENEVAAYKEWTPEVILERGLKMLSFLEERWKVPLERDDAKTRLLGLEFVRPMSGLGDGTRVYGRGDKARRP